MYPSSLLAVAGAEVSVEGVLYDAVVLLLSVAADDSVYSSSLLVVLLLLTVSLLVDGASVVSVLSVMLLVVVVSASAAVSSLDSVVAVSSSDDEVVVVVEVVELELPLPPSSGMQSSDGIKQINVSHAIARHCNLTRQTTYCRPATRSHRPHPGMPASRSASCCSPMTRTVSSPQGTPT